MIAVVKRYLVLFAGLWIMAFGVAFSIKANLGTSPISSVPYVVSLFAPLTVGNATILMHCVFILIQILLLRRKYERIQLMQLPVAFLFGYLTDFGVWALEKVVCRTYWQQWLACLAGIILVAVGVSLEVKADVVVLAGEGVVLAICKVLPVKFGFMKVGFPFNPWNFAGSPGRHRGGGHFRRPAGKAVREMDEGMGFGRETEKLNSLALTS